MPQLPSQVFKPLWQTTDGQTVRLYLGDVCQVLRKLPAASVQCVVTSPPYWGLRSYASGDSKHLELGSEPQPDCLGWASGQKCGVCHVCRILEVFREVRRVLRDDGVLWLNYGDTYASGEIGRHDQLQNEGISAGNAGIISKKGQATERKHGPKSGLKAGNLVGIPWRVALALQADGWILRSDIPWVKRCLSGGTIVYARTQKGEMPITVKDLVRLRPETVSLWNGEKWTQVIGFYQTPRTERANRAEKGDLEIEFRSGERVSCTQTHLWTTSRGLLRASDLIVGDTVPSVQLPEPSNPLRPSLISGEDVGWAVGFYLAEGHQQREDALTTFSVNVKEVECFERIRLLAESLGDSATFKVKAGNSATIFVYGRLFGALMREYVAGDTCYNKGLTSKAWQRDNAFLLEVINGYLEGDGSWEAKTKRWRLGFCNNDGLASDLRTLAARIGSRIRLRRTFHKGFDQSFPGWKGEWRHGASCTESTQGEIVAIRFARSRLFWDIEVADAPNTFALASGLLTHNSPMPESVKNRPAKALEYVFMLVKKAGYFYDGEAVRKAGSCGPLDRQPADGQRWDETKSSGEKQQCGSNGSRNFWQADLWFDSVDKPHGLTGIGDELVGLDVTSHGYKGAHYATFAPKLVEPLVKAGTSERGACVRCGAPWRRVVEVTNDTKEAVGGKLKALVGSSINDGNLRMGDPVCETVGWEATCQCGTDETRPCIVLDPFVGSGTVAEVCLMLGRRCWGIDLSREYLTENAVVRVQDVLRGRRCDLEELAGVVAKPVPLPYKGIRKS